MRCLAAICLALMIAYLNAQLQCHTVYEAIPYEEGQLLEFNCTVPDHLQTNDFVWDIDSPAPYSKSVGGHCAENDRAMITCLVQNATSQYQAEVRLVYIGIYDQPDDACGFRYQCVFYIPDQDSSSSFASIMPQSTATGGTSLTTKLPPVISTSVQHPTSAGQISPTPESSPSPEGSSINAIIAGVVLAGVIVTFVLMSGMVSAWCITRGRKCTRRKQDLHLSDVLGGAENTGFLLGAPEEEEEKLTFGAIVLMDLVHNGTFKVVHHGIFNTRDVIVKQLRDKESKMGQEELSDEISFIEELSDKAGQHPSILGLVGATKPPDNVCLVLEYVPHGTLKSFLRSLLLGPIPTWYLNHVKGSMVSHSYHKQTSKDLMRILEQIVDGASFLGQNGYCHGDLSIRNVVLGDKLITKLTNFGIKRTGHYYFQVGRHDYMQDMAPETVDGDEFSAASDVWSFGMLVFRVAALGGLDPYEGIHVEDLCCLVQEGLLPPNIPSISSELYFLLRQCWRLKPWERPNLGDILSHLSLLSQSPHSHLLLKVSMRRKGYIGSDGQAFLHPPPQSVYNSLQHTDKPSQRMSILTSSTFPKTETEQTTSVTSDDSMQSAGSESEEADYTLPQEWVSMMRRKISEREQDSDHHLRLALSEHKNPGKRNTLSSQQVSRLANMDSNPSDSGNWSPRTSDDLERYHKNLLTQQLLSNEPTLP